MTNLRVEQNFGFPIINNESASDTYTVRNKGLKSTFSLIMVDEGSKELNTRSDSHTDMDLGQQIGDLLSISEKELENLVPVVSEMMRKDETSTKSTEPMLRRNFSQLHSRNVQSFPSQAEPQEMRSTEIASWKSETKRKRKLPSDDADGKLHKWTHEDIMHLIWFWCRAQLEPKDDKIKKKKWVTIYENFRREHPWCSQTSIQAYFKSKIKSVYNCRYIYDHVLRCGVVPAASDPLVFLDTASSNPKKKHKE